MNTTSQSQPLRFAALVRVSTERQEKEGESLRAQQTQIGEAVRAMGGVIVARYGGQEHAMPGYEKVELHRMLRDAAAAQPQFNAVIVTNPDRWSRDNVESRDGLMVFKEHGIRFFALQTEFDLFKPEHEFFLGMSAVMGQFQARQQSLKSITARIHRAKRGIPTGGKLPYGREWNQKEGVFVVNETKQRLVEETARRYLDGESLEKLAREFRMNHANLYKILMKRCGTEWTNNFASKSANIQETVTITIPALLPEETIRAIRARADANRTYLHGSAKNQYLFSRLIFCGHCKQAMFGCANIKGRRFYRHHYARPNRSYHTKPTCMCSGPTTKSWLDADVLEQTIMRQLFADFGNPSGVQRAIESAMPNLQELKDAEMRKDRVEENLAKLRESRQAIIRLVVKSSLREEDASEQLDQLKKEEEELNCELERLSRQLAHIPSREVIESLSKSIVAQGGLGRYVNARLVCKKKHANQCFEEMTFSDRQTLVRLLFSAKRPDGERMGVYVEWNGTVGQDTATSWQYTLHGHLLATETHTLITAKMYDDVCNTWAISRQEALATILPSPRLRRALRSRSARRRLAVPCVTTRL